MHISVGRWTLMLGEMDHMVTVHYALPSFFWVNVPVPIFMPFKTKNITGKAGIKTHWKVYSSIQTVKDAERGLGDCEIIWSVKTEWQRSVSETMANTSQRLPVPLRSLQRLSELRTGNSDWDHLTDLLEKVRVSHGRFLALQKLEYSRILLWISAHEQYRAPRTMLNKSLERKPLI